MSIDEGNGRKIAVHEAEIDIIMESLKDIKETLSSMFGPNGICPAERSKIAGLGTHIKIQWWFIAGVVIGLITLALDKL